MEYKLVEIFESLQGEGRNAGKPCIFIRFAGCNLRCPWCDTDSDEKFTLSLDGVLAELAGYRVKNIVLTGGEPTIQQGMEEFVEALKKNGYWIAVETNGTNAVGWLKCVDYVACSPKAEFPELLRLNRANEIRVVASSEEVVDFCRAVRGKCAADDYYVSPCDHNGNIDLATAKNVLNKLEGWSLSVQLHKILGIR